MILKVENLCSGYDKSQILFGMNLEVEEGESVCVLGRNGVGKTTTLKTLMGVLKPMSGKIEFEGKEIGGLPSYKVCRRGMSYVPQGRMIFPNLTCKENLILSVRKGVDGSDDWSMERIYELFPRLKERESSLGGQLSGGEQQMLAVARGLVQNPRLLLMDEICEGLAPVIVQELAEIIQELRRQGVSILLAEQSVKFALAVSSRCYIMEKGAVVYSGKSAEIPSEIFAQYLGV